MFRRLRASDDASWSVVLFATALLLRVAFLLCVSVQPAWDGVLYERGARAIARGLGYSTFMFVQRSSDTVATAYYPVGYPALIGTIYRFTGEHLRVLQFVGALLSAVTVLLVHRVALRASTPWRARLAALLVAVNPGQIAFAGAAMTEPFVGLLLILAVWTLCRDEGPMTLRSLAALSVVLVMATYTRPQSVLLAPLLPLLRTNPWGSGIKARAFASLLVVSAVLLGVMPWSVRNCARLDACAFVSTNGGSNLAIGAVPRGNGEFLFLNADDGCRGVRGEVARDRCWRSVALRSVRSSPWRWITLAPHKLEATLRKESFPIDYLREGRSITLTDAQRERWVWILTMAWRVILVLACVGALPLSRALRGNVAARAALITVLVLLASHVVFFGGDRYHLPLVPLLAVLASRAGLGAVASVRAHFNSSTTHH